MVIRFSRRWADEAGEELKAVMSSHNRLLDEHLAEAGNQLTPIRAVSHRRWRRRHGPDRMPVLSAIPKDHDGTPVQLDESVT